MADYKSSLPVRTENPGDVASIMVDATNTALGAKVDSSGNQYVILNNSGPIEVDGTVTANQGTANTTANAWPIKLTDGTNTAPVSATNGVSVTLTTALPAGSNTIGIVNAHISDATGTAFSQSNPLPVSFSDAIAGATEVLDFKATTDTPATNSDTHNYTPASGKILTLQKIIASGSGKIKVEILLGTTGAEALKIVLFNSTSNPNVEYAFGSPQKILDTQSVKVTVTNLDKQAQNLYSTIEGYLL